MAFYVLGVLHFIQITKKSRDKIISRGKIDLVGEMQNMEVFLHKLPFGTPVVYLSRSSGSK
ncbi:MAG: hypothetical protein KIPDCIKN_00851 [Haliscomenobacter sp.]|jgi:hypothetical protein|nr:hypothetical protein [Haliscomenobacter sp.]